MGLLTGRTCFHSACNQPKKPAGLYPGAIGFQQLHLQISPSLDRQAGSHCHQLLTGRLEGEAQ